MSKYELLHYKITSYYGSVSQKSTKNCLENIVIYFRLSCARFLKMHHQMTQKNTISLKENLLWDQIY